jgi:nitrite reductase/ring-hydroxylating ferredoxin subunit
MLAAPIASTGPGKIPPAAGCALFVISSTQRSMRGPIVDNPRMLKTTDWHPVVPAHLLAADERLLATRVLGQDLVAWRSTSGVAQVWLDRCPHRGVRLSLGRILGGRLSCAYHGWEFAPDTGRCEAIPALADLARLPGQTHASVCEAAESRQMVWVRLSAGNAASAAPAEYPVAGPTAPAPGNFLRSFAIDTSLEVVHTILQLRGFQPDGPATWTGALEGGSVRMFLQVMQDDQVIVHAWTCELPAPKQHAGLFAALRRLRHDAESAIG